MAEWLDGFLVSTAKTSRTCSQCDHPITRGQRYARSYDGGNRAGRCLLCLSLTPVPPAETPRKPVYPDLWGEDAREALREILSGR